MLKFDSIHSPFRYAGGKYYARKLILDCIPSHTAYCEPFAGGGSIFFAKPKVAHNVLNDMDQDLVLVYRTLRDYPEDLIAFLQTTIYPSKDSHIHYKNVFEPQTDIETAGRWYYLNRISYSGIMKKQNCFWGYGDKFSMRPENWPKAIRAASAKLQSVAITNADFETSIDQAPDGSFLFVDPPYFNADQDKFYTVAFDKADHGRLSDTLQRNSKRLSFLLTYDDCAAIRALYGWSKEVDAKEWNYCISRSDDQKTKTAAKGKRAKGKEVFISNYTTAKDALNGEYFRMSGIAPVDPQVILESVA